MNFPVYIVMKFYSLGKSLNGINMDVTCILKGDCPDENFFFTKSLLFFASIDLSRDYAAKFLRIFVWLEFYLQIF